MDKYIQKLISQGDQDIALKELLKATKGLDNPKFHQEAVHLSARWEANQQEKRQGTTSSEDYNITQAQITAAILELTQRLPENLKGHSQSILQSKWVKWSGAAVVFIGVLAGLAKLSGYSLKDLFTNQPIESFSVSVLVHGKEGRDDKILTNGKAILDIGGNRIEEEINSQGEAIFPALRKEYIGKSAFISIDHPQPYYPTHRNKEYILQQGQSIYLEVALTGINKIWGKVMDFETEQMLDSVRVSVR
ncbi:MAG: hypothetical protein KDE26_10925, partial [Bacteroidetes bacterium]|nr:hypothetical protein [Bacteroidota bacterium]